MKVKRVKGDGAKRLALLLKDLKSNKVSRVGWFESAKYNNKQKTPVAYVATIHEFGDPKHNIPPRPTMRPAIAKNKKLWRTIAQQGAKNILKGEDTITGVLEDIGLKAVGNIKEQISSLTSPRLKDSTIQARIKRYAAKTKKGNPPAQGIEKPLVDSGLLLDSIINVITEKNAK